MTLNEIRQATRAATNIGHRVEFAEQTDPLLWIEHNIFPLISVDLSICSSDGFTAAVAVEDVLSE